MIKITLYNITLHDMYATNVKFMTFIKCIDGLRRGHGDHGLEANGLMWLYTDQFFK